MFQWLVLFLMVWPTGYAAGITNVTKTIQDSDSPVALASYTARFRKSERYITEGIHHSILYKNRSDRLIQAVQITFISFSVFNRFLDRTGGISIEDLEPDETKRGTWVATAYADFSFLTGIAFVSKVRFSDGTIWTYNEQRILRELREIQEDFDVEKLREGSERQ